MHLLYLLTYICFDFCCSFIRIVLRGYVPVTVTQSILVSLNFYKRRCLARVLPVFCCIVFVSYCALVPVLVKKNYLPYSKLFSVIPIIFLKIVRVKCWRRQIVVYFGHFSTSQYHWAKNIIFASSLSTLYLLNF